jgi:hypothetical protein
LQKYIWKDKNFALLTQNLGIEVKTFSPDPRQAEEALGFVPSIASAGSCPRRR